MAHSIQVHIPVIVEITVIDNGDIVDVGTPYISRDALYSLGDGTDTWDESTEEWRRATEDEWDVADSAVESALRLSYGRTTCEVCSTPKSAPIIGGYTLPVDITDDSGEVLWECGTVVNACDTCVSNAMTQQQQERRGQ